MTNAIEVHPNDSLIRNDPLRAQSENETIAVSDWTGSVMAIGKETEDEWVKMDSAPVTVNR